MKNMLSLGSLMLVALVCSPFLTFAVATPAGGGNAAPLDGGVSLLVAAGVGYGAKKIAARKKTAESNK